MTMFFPSACSSAEQRNRLSCGSLEAHTAQGHAITGTPCDVPVPKKVTLIFEFFLIALFFLILL